MVSIKDIAEKAGISRGTVDRVLHGRGRVAPETRELVLSLAKEMGYTPSAAGMALAAHKKKLCLGMFYYTGTEAPFFLPVERSARAKAAELEQLGCETVFFPIPVDGSPAALANLREMLRTSWDRVQGFAVPGVGEELDKLILEAVKDPEALPKPAVFYNMDGSSPILWDRIGYVGCDYEHSGRIACGLAARMSGFRGRVLLISVDSGSISSSALRIRGFLDEMARRFPEMHAAGTVFAPEPPESVDVAERACRMIRENPDIRAVYIANPGNYSICARLQEAAGDRHLCIVTNDLIDERQQQMLEDDVISATICQEPERQGERPLQLLYEYFAYGTSPDPVWEKTKLEIMIGQSLQTAAVSPVRQ